MTKLSEASPIYGERHESVGCPATNTIIGSTKIDGGGRLEEEENEKKREEIKCE